MTKFVNRIVVLGLTLGLTSGVALAKPIRKRITFAEPVKVNGVYIKPGTYDVAFNEPARELTISKGKRVIAKAPAELERLDKDSRIAYELSSDNADNIEPKLLKRVGLKDRIQAKLLNATDVKVEGVRQD